MKVYVVIRGFCEGQKVLTVHRDKGRAYRAMADWIMTQDGSDFLENEARATVYVETYDTDD